MLARLRIGPKLLLAPAVVLALLIVSSCAAWYAMVRQNQSLETIVQVRAARIKDANDLISQAQSAHARSYQMLTWISGSFSRARIDALAADIGRRHAAIDRTFATLTVATPPGSAERRFLEQSEAAHADYVKAIADVIELAQSDQSIGANAMIKAERAFEVVARRLGELSQLEQQLSEAASRRAAEDFRLVAVLMPLLAALSLVLSLAVTMAVRRALLAEVRGIGQAAVKLASGDLTVAQRDYGSDEISDTSRVLDASIRHLNQTLKTIQDSARELTSTVDKTADSALAARLMQMLASLKGGASKVRQLSSCIEQLAAQSGALALTAEVEAARSGAHGNGIALVAGEMRQLARRSGEAAREIGALALQAVGEIEGGSAAALDAGCRIAWPAADPIGVAGGTGGAGGAGGTGGTGETVLEVEQMSQQNSVLVKQASAAAASLQDQAMSLSKAVAGFRLDEAPPPVPAARSRLRLASKRD